MIRSLWAVTLVLSFALISACGKPTDRPRSTTFSDQKGAPADPEKTPEETDEGSDVAVPAPIGETNSSNKNLPTQPRDSEEQARKKAESEPEYLVPYELPPSLDEHINKEKYKKRPKEELKFALEKPHLKISVPNKLMTFTTIMKVKGKADEKIEMSCAFNPQESPWHCDDMFPTDKKIAQQRRLQATVNCLETKYTCTESESLECYQCSNVGFDFITVVDGKKQLQHFESKPVQVYMASSGDIEDIMDTLRSDGDAKSEPQAPPKKDEPQETAKPIEQPKQEKPKDEPLTPLPDKDRTEEEPNNTPPSSITEERPALTNKEIAQALKDQEETNQGVEYNAPITTPAPKKDSEYSIPDLDTFIPARKYDVVKDQAQRSHINGWLKDAGHLNREKNSGYVISSAYDDANKFPRRAYGADVTIDLIKLMSAKTRDQFPNRPPLRISNIAKKGGKALCSKDGCQASHKNGLDADISFPALTPHEGWNAVNEPSRLDVARLLYTASIAVCSGKEVIAFFMDRSIKKRACKYAKEQGYDLKDSTSCVFKALRHMTHEPGHRDHFHMRVACPGNLNCDNWGVSLTEGTGC